MKEWRRGMRRGRNGMRGERSKEWSRIRGRRGGRNGEEKEWR